MILTYVVTSLQLTQVADALSFLHKHDPSVIHDDVKGVRTTMML